MVEGKGINDMPKGWRIENNWNKKAYQTWKNMIVRCYSDNLHKRKPTYIGCTVCDRWLILSNFVKDLPNIDGYDKENFLCGKLQLDKDIKSNGTNKEYSLKNCIFVSALENKIQANKTRDYSDISMKIKQIDFCGNLIKIWNSAKEIERELGIANQSIISCCKFWKINCDKEEWFKSHKNYPNKSAGGYVWQYVKEEEN